MDEGRVGDAVVVRDGQGPDVVIERDVDEGVAILHRVGLDLGRRRHQRADGERRTRLGQDITCPRDRRDTLQLRGGRGAEALIDDRARDRPGSRVQLRQREHQREHGDVCGESGRTRPQLQARPEQRCDAVRQT